MVQEYLVEARTPEEAEAIAEQYDDDGEVGVLTVNQREYTDSVPVEEAGDGDLQEVNPYDEVED